MMATSKEGSETSRPPVVTGAIKQKTAFVRCITEWPDGYDVTLMSEKELDGYPEPHRVHLEEDDMDILLEVLDCSSVEQAQEMLPSNGHVLPCEQKGPEVWIALMDATTFGWELSVVMNEKDR